MKNYCESDTTDQLTYGNLSSYNNLSKYKDGLKFRLAVEATTHPYSERKRLNPRTFASGFIN